MVEGEISFGRFLNLARRELRRDETLVRLGGRARDILCVRREADVSGISLAPAPPGGCERYPHRQVWTRHRCGRFAGGGSTQLFWTSCTP